MSLLSGLRIGRTAMQAASTAIEVTSHNVSNAGTDGYSRQIANLQTRDPVLFGRRGMGQGVDVAAIARTSDTLIRHQLVDSTGLFGFHDSAHTVMATLEANLGDLENGLTTELSSFFDSMESATIDPANPGRRTDVLTQAAALATALNNAAGAAQSSAEQAEEQLSGTLDDANAMLDDLARVNEMIGGGNPSADWLDQRDLLIRDLASLTGAVADVEPNGQAVLFIGQHAAVSGNEARHLSLTESSDGVSIEIETGASTLTITDKIGGQIGGLQAGASVARETLAELDEFAAAFADAVNAKHNTGFDAYGNPGGDVFTYDADDPALTLSLDATLAEDGSLLAFAGDANAYAGDTSNLSSMIEIRNTALLGDDSPEEALANLHTSLGTSVARAEAEAQHQASINADLTSLNDAVSGVDLDEEASKLLQYQASYEAAIRVVEAMNSMLEELMGAVR